MKNIIKPVLSFIICGAVLFGGSYAYLTYKGEEGTKKSGQTAQVEVQKNDEPYIKTPDNKVLLVSFDDKSGVLVDMNFKKNKISASYIEDTEYNEKMINGKKVDYNCEMDFSVLGDFVDRTGGINFKTDLDILRLTGVDVAGYMNSGIIPEQKEQMLKGLFRNLKKNGLSRDDICFLLDNCTVPSISILDCLSWAEFIKNNNTKLVFGK